MTTKDILNKPMIKTGYSWCGNYDFSTVKYNSFQKLLAKIVWKLAGISPDIGNKMMDIFPKSYRLAMYIHAKEGLSLDNIILKKEAPIYSNLLSECYRCGRTYNTSLDDLRAYSVEINNSRIDLCDSCYEDLRYWIMHLDDKKKTGHWIDTGSGQECSECGEIQHGYDNFRFYCAKCGSKNGIESEE